VNETHEVTQLLQKAQQGDTSARDALLERCYRELHSIARRQAVRERHQNTLQPTALLHEAYLRLFGGEQMPWQNRAHFFAIAARQMRQVLVDYARTRGAQKRGGDRAHVSLEETDGAREFEPEQILFVHEALQRLEEFEPRLSRLVECKYFAGLTDEEIAEALGLSFAQVRRDWSFARSWLQAKLAGNP
jgi:RNA polymerase sigma factor (TIGR02999 family)